MAGATGTDAGTARIRRNWKRAVQCSPALVAPSRYASELMEFSLALGGPTLQAQYESFRAHPDGRRLLAERPDLRSVLGNREALASLPERSFGRAYLDFTGRYRFDAAAFDAGHDLEGMAQRLGWDDDLLYVIARGLQLHDLWHTLGGYGPDWAGEAGVMAFTYGQIPDVGIGVIAGILRAIPGGTSRRTWKVYLAQARARGRRSNNLLVVPYEDLLAAPIDEVRHQLGIAATELAHPQGIPHSSFRYGFAKAMETAYEPYAGAASDGAAA
ncbi:MAG: Coq4 family protein [Microthrixaceae bacterium]